MYVNTNTNQQTKYVTNIKKWRARMGLDKRRKATEIKHGRL